MNKWEAYAALTEEPWLVMEGGTLWVCRRCGLALTSDGQLRSAPSKTTRMLMRHREVCTGFSTRQPRAKKGLTRFSTESTAPTTTNPKGKSKGKAKTKAHPRRKDRVNGE